MLWLTGSLWLASIEGCAGPTDAGAKPAASTRTASATSPLMAARRRSMDCLSAAMRYPHNPVVRVEAVEALESAGGEPALPWIRSALMDEQAGVRFAACVAAGRLRDRVSERAIRERLQDPDASVAAAAIFALHRLGDTRESGRLTAFLLQHKEVMVRRNAALLLGLLGEPSAIKVLARAMSDPDPGVRHHALEAMARLGNPEARQELVFMANAGVGSEEVFAVAALGETGDSMYIDTLRYRLANAPHLETRLAAARGLGRLGSSDGFDTALRALASTPTPYRDPNDNPADQLLRVRQLAAAALGAIGKDDAVPALTRMMESSTDPRIQVSAARAILEIGQSEGRGAAGARASARRG
jgi:HEAT repeat protein